MKKFLVKGHPTIKVIEAENIVVVTRRLRREIGHSATKIIERRRSAFIFNVYKKVAITVIEKGAKR